MKSIILTVMLLLPAGALAAPMTQGDNLSAPIIAATDNALKAPQTTSIDPLGFMPKSWVDGPISADGGGYYIATHSADSNTVPEPGSVMQVMSYGSYDAPYSMVMWVKPTCQRNGVYCTKQTTGANAFTSFASGLTNVENLWFTSIYNAGGSERLAFIHEENVGGTGFNEGTAPLSWEGQTRIGLAYSADSGNTWKYLGRIAEPYQAAQPWNIQGAPYVVINGRFYIWYWDCNNPQNISGCGGYAVSKANVASVLAAARAGNLGSGLWQKQTPSGWSTNIAAQPAFSAGTQAQGIVHAQAAHSTDGNYYLVTTAMTGANWPTTASYVKLFTIDPTTLAWTWVMDIVSEPTASFVPDSGYQYASIVDATGNSNGEVGSSFYVYSGKFQNQTTTPYTQALYQWQVYSSPPVGFYKESAQFSSTQGNYNWNYAAVLSGAWMTWNGSYWQTTDPYNRILSGGMSTGSSDGFLLTWTAPQAGNITVRQTVRTSQPTAGCGGNGVNIAFQQNSNVLMAGLVGPTDTLGMGLSSNLAVKAGDHLYFYGTKNGPNNFCDGLYWDPSIIYN